MTSFEPDMEETGRSESLDRSQEAIDDAKEAARAAMEDPAPDSDLDVPGVGEGLEEDQEDVAPRPN